MCRPRALKPYRAGLVSKKPVAGLQFLSFKLRNRFCEKCIYENYFQKINSYTASPPLLLCRTEKGAKGKSKSQSGVHLHMKI